ncbi:MAG: hypothetical protein AABY04_02915 [Candidatus Micrarchaeota archaeon]
MRVRSRLRNSKKYHYLEETLRLEKPKAYSVFLGSKMPSNAKMRLFREKLIDKIIRTCFGKRNVFI